VRQRGFTVLEMMLVVLLMGSAASLVIMSFPAMQQDTAERQLQRFQAQLGLPWIAVCKTIGYWDQIRPNGWQFQVLQSQAAETRSSVAHSDRWQGYVWQIWQPRQAALGGQVPDNQPLTLRLPPLQEWPPTAEPAADPDILLLPGGEITPFTLIFGEKTIAPKSGCG
jgi:general secretion pathway protein H